MADPVIRGNSLYTVVDGPSWTQAEANSVKLGGHLVTINSKEEDVWLSKNVYGDQYIINGGTPSLQNPINSYYIGYNDIATERLYRWSSGEEVTYNGVASPPTFDDSHPNAVNTDVFVVGSNADGSTGHWINVDNTASWYRDGNIPVVSVDIKAIIETPFIRRGDSAYVVVQGPTWEEAEANAVKLGGHLVTINDAGENEWLYNQGLIGWIGFTDKANEGNWVWTSGEPVTYSNWLPDSPSNTWGTEHYANNGSRSWGDSNNNGDGNGGPDIKGIAEIKLAPNINPTGTPTLSGTFESGQSIAVDKTPIQDGDNFAGYTPAYKTNWEVSGDNGGTWSRLTSADATDNNATYSLTSSEVGKKIRGVISYLDGHGTNEVVNSGASSQITTSEPPPPTYSVTHSQSGTVEEGETLTTTLETTGVEEGATIYWTADGENIDEDDFSSGELSGEATVDADGKVTISHTLANDETTEEDETLQFAFYSDEDHQTPVTRRSTVTVSDTSKTPPTYTISSSSPAINEGGTLNTTVRTTDLPAGTKIYWSAGGTGIDDNDFSEGELSGEGIIGEDGTFTFSHKLAYDNKTEGTETLQIKLYSNSDHTAQLGETESTKIIDTSRNSVIIAKQEGDAYAGINDDLPRGQSNVVGIRTKNLNVNGNGEFDSDVDSTSTAVATTGNGNASAHVRQSLLGISISDSSRIGGDGKFTSILTHDSDNSASAVNGTADVQDRINSVSIDASNLNVHGKSNFGSYMSVRSQNSADTTQTNDENISTNASATLNRNQLLGEPNIVGMRFDNVNLGGKGVFNSQVDNTSDMSANSIRGDASTLSNNSVLGIGFNGASRITGDAQVTSLLTQRSFSDAQSVHGTAITEDHHSVIGVEAHDLTVTGNATFSSTVVVRALSNSGT